MISMATLRQWRYPRAFRIARPVWNGEWLPALEALAAALPPAPDAGTSGQKGAPADTEQARLLATVATNLWRMQQRMVDPATGEPLEEMRRVYRHLQSSLDALAEGGVEIQDHTGARFDAGSALTVLAYQPTAGLDREQVIETIKPTIYYHGRHIQMGEVVVGTPTQEA